MNCSHPSTWKWGQILGFQTCNFQNHLMQSLTRWRVLKSKKKNVNQGWGWITGMQIEKETKIFLPYRSHQWGWQTHTVRASRSSCLICSLPFLPISDCKEWSSWDEKRATKLVETLKPPSLCKHQKTWQKCKNKKGRDGTESSSPVSLCIPFFTLQRKKKSH